MSKTVDNLTASLSRQMVEDRDDQFAEKVFGRVVARRRAVWIARSMITSLGVVGAGFAIEGLRRVALVAAAPLSGPPADQDIFAMVALLITSAAVLLLAGLWTGGSE